MPKPVIIKFSKNLLVELLRSAGRLMNRIIKAPFKITPMTEIARLKIVKAIDVCMYVCMYVNFIYSWLKKRKKKERNYIIY